MEPRDVGLILLRKCLSFMIIAAYFSKGAIIFYWERAICLVRRGAKIFLGGLRGQNFGGFNGGPKCFSHAVRGPANIDDH